MDRRTVVSITTLLIFILVLLFLQTPLMRPIRAKTWDFFTITIARTFHIRGIQNEQSTIDQLEQLRSENTQLQAEVRRLRRDAQQLGVLSIENMQAIPAAVVSRPIDTFGSQFIISRGIKDGITVGSPVVIQGSTLIGFVHTVNESSAVIQTLFHPETHITIETVPKDSEKPSARGLLESRYYTALYLTTVPRDTELHEGESVVTSMKDQGLPPGLVVGTIDSIWNPQHEAYQEARLKLSYDIDQIDAVYVLVAP